MSERRAIALLLALVFACISPLLAQRKRPERTPKKTAVQVAKPRKSSRGPSAAKVTQATQATQVAALQAAQQKAVQRWMRSMTLRDKIAQLVMITSYGENPRARSSEFRDFSNAVRNLKVGGIIVVNRVSGGLVRNAEPRKMTTFLNRMQKLAKIPLIVGGDFERGASMRVSGTAKYPHLMAYGATGDLSLTRALGAATAREARALGVHWVFAPVADVNSNPENPIINVRSFGEDPDAVAAHVSAFIQGAHSNKKNPILVTAKHFPGHGDTSVDSHMGLPVLLAERSRLEKLELVPFRAAIRAGVDSVMTAHMSVPAIETEEEIPATVSPKVLTGLLRKELSFDGLIVTDAMDMAGLDQQIPGGEAAVRSLQAGADMLLMPTNPAAAINAVAAAVEQGRLTEERIDVSVRRLLHAKVALGLNRIRYVDVEKVETLIEAKDLAAQAQLAADRAVTMVKNEGSLVPIQRPETACVLILPENPNGKQGKRLQEEARLMAPAMRTYLLTPEMLEGEIEAAMAELTGCETLVVAGFVSVSAYRGNVALKGSYPRLLEAVLARKLPTVLLSLGNPYLLRSFPEVNAYLATFSSVATSEAAAVKALLGFIPIRGHLPVRIPGFAAIGEGIESLAR